MDAAILQVTVLLTYKGSLTAKRWRSSVVDPTLTFISLQLTIIYIIVLIAWSITCQWLVETTSEAQHKVTSWDWLFCLTNKPKEIQFTIIKQQIFTFEMLEAELFWYFCLRNFNIHLFIKLLPTNFLLIDNCEPSISFCFYIEVKLQAAGITPTTDDIWTHQQPLLMKTQMNSWLQSRTLLIVSLFLNWQAKNANILVTLFLFFPWSQVCYNKLLLPG